MQQYIVCVGTVYIDTILDVPHFPIEDEKLRAQSMTRRRGGNCANALEVIEQLIEVDSHEEDMKEKIVHPAQLCLITVLPNQRSDDVKFIQDSIKNTHLDGFGIYRKDIPTAASSMILRNGQTGTRTIVSHNALPEMNVEEFVARIDTLIPQNETSELDKWIHFEGRNELVSVQCIRYLRCAEKHSRVRISVELEKPSRTDMYEGAKLADVVFYSSIWAKANNHSDPVEFLKTQTQHMRSDAILICMWGSEGIVAVRKHQNTADEWEKVVAWKPFSTGSYVTTPAVVDAIGAGDTFIAGMLFALTHRENTWNFRKILEFAVEIAGRKVFQHGFQGLGHAMRADVNNLNTD
ncbi:ketohexokinase-like protein [Dendryphion nanum]|uniref:Ketohexokinase-like protein n=1 Tax=Dendryphion nanum TaxID=256645 RepID=A0A9P9DX23_9PLEO|nr:ketohexokinase-like protein [Dendryphion nanum]